MAKMDPKAQAHVISAEEFAQGWDSERRVHDLNPLTFHLRGSTMYVPTRTKADMDESMGGPAPAVKTRTFETEYRVWISPCKSGTPNARRLRSASDTESAAEFGFAVPLRKLGVKVPQTRQYTFQAKRIPVEGGGVVYEISFKDYENLPRDVDEAALAAAKAAKAEKVKARRSKKKAEASGPAETQTKE